MQNSSSECFRNLIRQQAAGRKRYTVRHLKEKTNVFRTIYPCSATDRRHIRIAELKILVTALEIELVQYGYGYVQTAMEEYESCSDSEIIRRHHEVIHLINTVAQTRGIQFPRSHIFVRSGIVSEGTAVVQTATPSFSPQVVRGITECLSVSVTWIDTLYYTLYGYDNGAWVCPKCAQVWTRYLPEDGCYNA